MGRIKDTDLYNFDEFLSLDDYLIGTDADTPTGKTKNYKLANVFATFKSALQLTSLEFTFSDGSDPELDETDPAYFTANDTVAGAIGTLRINKQTLSGADISVLVDVVAENVSSFMIRLFKPSGADDIFYFQISSIVDSGTYYTFTVTNFVGGNILTDGTTYGLVFDLAGVPSIYNETDPIFLASDAAAVTALKISNWDTAFGWGDHGTVGYLTSESDPVFSASAAFTILNVDIANWDAAYSWGDHSVQGYLTSESDPTVGAHIKAILGSDINNWNLAYGWGDHGTVGYLTSESDPVFSASDAAGITNADITNWNTAYVWGNHALFGYLREINIDTLAELNSIVTDATLLSSVEIDSSYVSLSGDTMSGTLIVPTVIVNGSGDNFRNYGSDVGDANFSYLSFYESNGTTRQGYVGFGSGSDSSIQLKNDTAGSVFYLTGLGGSNGIKYDFDGTEHTVWHSGNDGAGSGLDADLLDGLDSSSFLRRDVDTTKTSGFLKLNDNLQFVMGSGGDFKLEHDASNNNIILNNGDLIIKDVSTTRVTFDKSSGNITTTGGVTTGVGGNVTIGASAMLSHNTSTSRDKIRVWNSNLYTIGMDSLYTYGGLNNDFAMTFQMNNDNDRGFWWGNSAHTKAQGAMALTTSGYLTLANHARVGYGESDTTAVSTTYTIQANGTIQATNFILSSDKRLKENIKNYEARDISVHWRIFDWIDGDNNQIGVIAQELQESHPEFVVEDDDGMLSVKYTDLLIAKMAEKDRQVESLEERVDRLEKMIMNIVPSLN